MEYREDRDERPTQPIAIPRDLQEAAENTQPASPVQNDRLPDAGEQGATKGRLRRVAEAEAPAAPPIENETLLEEVPGLATEPQPKDRAPHPSHEPPAVSQDHIDTPAPILLTPEPVVMQAPPRGTSRLLKIAVVLSLLLSIVSLTLAGYLSYRLMRVQSEARRGIEEAVAAIESVGQEGFHYDYKFENTVPFSGDIPFKQDLIFPFKGQIPINTTVKVPVDMGFLKTEIEVPIDTTFDLDLSVPIHVDETIHVDTEIPLSLEIPIDIEPGDPALQEMIDPIR
ncbi:hypothetical protein ACFLT5_01035, partial [Chloroflexota bacterium]